MQDCRSVVDVRALIENCYTDYCIKTDDETLRDIYEAFFAACKVEKGNEGSVCTWKEELGYESCQNGKVWRCGNNCDEQTCDQRVGCFLEDPYEGCFCPENHVWHEGACIPEDDCPAGKLFSFNVQEILLGTKKITRKLLS